MAQVEHDALGARLELLATAALTSSPEPDVKPASRTQAIFLPPERSIRLSTIGMSTFARFELEPLACRRGTPSVTVVPAGPLISSVASSEVLPASDLPLTLTIRSPGFRPPSFAGESS